MSAGLLTTERADLLATEIAERRAKLEANMADQGLDALVVASEGNFTYLVGYQTFFWTNKSKPILLVFLPGRTPVAVPHAGESISVGLDGIDVEVRPYLDPVMVETSADPGYELDYILGGADMVASILAEASAKSIGFELSSSFNAVIPQAAIQRISDKLSAATIADCSPILWSLRRYKSDYELGKLRDAAAVLAKGFERFEREAKVGLIERELARLWISILFDCGADRVPYINIIADAERALTGGPTHRRWEPGQLLSVDGCIKVDGYWADYCRIYSAGKATPKQAKEYRTLQQLLPAARASVASGEPIGELAKALTAPDVGLFGRVGHGLGLDMPEPPSLNVLETAELKPGLVLCLEPTRHVAGVGWLVAEEEVAVTENGLELISPEFPEEMLAL